MFLARSIDLPNFYEKACPDSQKGIDYNNAIHYFLEFVLLRQCSEDADDGERVISPAFRNPVPQKSKDGIPRRNESVYSPLPYGYIAELRQMLAEGEHFRDWQWAQGAIGAEIGTGGIVAPDWFEVTEDQIDRDDPDCVWRVRKFSPGYRDGGQVLEMWSPVRWVALLVKLILPLRTFQVRMLDSGEADTLRYEAGTWVSNPNRLGQGSERRPLQQGVFRRSDSLVVGGRALPLLYINTNKTADIAKSGPEKGYTFPWISIGPICENVFHWLEKLRNWQEKYNPISRRTSWSELDNRHISVKSEVQLASYPDACFLFRLPEARDGENHLPLTDNVLERCWFGLLEALEQQFANRGETHSNGTPIRFLPPPEARNFSKTTLFPLHSLRVSLITALALDGKVPVEILYRLVGHSRLLMTLYYIKPGMAYINGVLADAAEQMEANKEKSIQNFLLDTEYDELLQKAICNDPLSLAAAIPRHPAARNAAGWMSLHHGMCLVGGNTSEIESNGKIGGCFNGGPVILSGSSSNKPKHGPVPGGSQNCVRCRWFVTEPHYLPALAAHCENLCYHCDEAKLESATREDELQNLKKQKADIEDSGQPFTQMKVYRQAERLFEKTMKKFGDLLLDLAACRRLMDRCKEAHESGQKDKRQLVAVGTLSDVQFVYEETDSELLQVAGVCENIELYPDLEPGKAIGRFAQLLDAPLIRERKRPVFILLSERDQLLACNAWMRNLAVQMNPSNPGLGKREVIRLIDAGESLSERFGVDITSLLPERIRSSQPVDAIKFFDAVPQPLLGGGHER